MGFAIGNGEGERAEVSLSLWLSSCEVRKEPGRRTGGGAEWIRVQGLLGVRETGAALKCRKVIKRYNSGLIPRCRYRLPRGGRQNITNGSKLQQ